MKICWASSNDIRTRVYQCLSYARSRNRFYSDWITCTVAAALSTLVRITPASRFSISSRTDLKPENVLIAIDDVESIISAELAASLAAPYSTDPNHPGFPSGNPNTAPTTTRKIVGVPPSKGRGGNQTPRSESVFITGSQPLPSPSSSFVSSPGLDRWAFKMSKIEADEPKKDDDGAITMKMGKKDDRDIVAEVGAVSLDTRAGYVGRAAPDNHRRRLPSARHCFPSWPPLPHLDRSPCPFPREKSLDVPSIQETPSSVMSVDRESTSSGSGEVYIDQQEKITVKIADLGERCVSLPFLHPTLSVLSIPGRVPRLWLLVCAFLGFAHTMSFKLYGIFHEGLPFRHLRWILRVGGVGRSCQL